jgi:hypothetical protein
MPIEVKPAERKSGKPSLTLKCSKSAAHFRGFINDQDFVMKALQASERPAR